MSSCLLQHRAAWRGCSVGPRRTRCATSPNTIAPQAQSSSFDSNNIAAVDTVVTSIPLQDRDAARTISPTLTAAVDFLKEEVPRCMQTGDITKGRYSEDVTFTDPIAQFNNIDGYAFNVRFLATVFDVQFELLDIAITGPQDITTRWSMELKLKAVPLLPVTPTAVFSGISEYKVDPATGLISKHVDKWDSIENNDFLSLEGLQYMVKSFTDVKLTPDLETPRYTILYKTDAFEVRSYQPYLVSETPMPPGSSPASGSGFTDLANYIFGGNSAKQSMEMTTPVFTAPAAAAAGGDAKAAKMQFVMERRFEEGGLPEPAEGAQISSRTEAARVQAVATFSGFPLDFEVVREERALRAALLQAGLKPKSGYLLARYNEPTAPPFLRRNEVLIELDGFQLPTLQ